MAAIRRVSTTGSEMNWAGNQSYRRSSLHQRPCYRSSRASYRVKSWSGKTTEPVICHMAHFVAIGRASRPFPRPKHSMRLSPHCAFRFDPRTREEQTYGCPWGGAPVGPAYRHLLSSRRLFVPLFKDVPWRTFTVSAPLQHGIWLLRRLRPPVRTLAFSCPAEAGDAAWEFPRSRAICDRVP